MLVGKFLAVAFATVVAAQDDGQYLGTIFELEGYTGFSLVFDSPAKCVNLQDPLRENVHSIHLAPGSQCDFYLQDDCEDFKVQFFQSIPVIEGDIPIVQSVRCGAGVGLKATAEGSLAA